jgi:hypothetical protein
MAAPTEINNLVERFEQHLESYRSGNYNEAQLRKEFVDPMFRALGWDMDNVSGYAEAYKDVIHEDAIKIGGATKAPDYCFRIGGTRKFFLEAKKPSVDIKGRCPPRLSTAALCVVRKTPPQHPDRFRGVRSLRLSRRTGSKRQGGSRTRAISRLQ